MPKKQKLDVLFDFDELTIFGISCQLPDYRMVWQLNKTFSFNFVKHDDFLFVPSKEEQAVSFPFYQYLDCANFKEYYILSNKVINKHIINEYKAFNYLLIVKGILDEEQKSMFIKDIKGIKNVLLSQNLDLSIIKNIEIFNNDFELFLTELNKKRK